MLVREHPVRMRVHRQPLSCVEELDQESGRGPEAAHMVGAEPEVRIGLDRVAEEPPIRETRESLLRIVAPRVRRSRHQADPVLRKWPVLLRSATQPAEERTASVEAVHACRQKRVNVDGHLKSQSQTA